MTGFILSALLSAPPDAPPVDVRLTKLENDHAQLRAELVSRGVIADTPKPPDSWIAKPQTAAPVQTHPYLFNVGDSINKPTGPAAAQFYQAGGWDGQPVQYSAPVMQQRYSAPVRSGGPIRRFFGGGRRGGDCSGS